MIGMVISRQIRSTGSGRIEAVQSRISIVSRAYVFHAEGIESTSYNFHHCLRIINDEYAEGSPFPLGQLSSCCRCGINISICINLSKEYQVLSQLSTC